MLIFGCSVILLMLLALLVKYGFKSRSNKLEEDAIELANHGDWKPAAEKAASAANLDKKNIEVLRLAVLTAMRTDAPPLPGLTERLFKEGVTSHDRYIALRADAIATQWVSYDKKLSALSQKERDTETFGELEVISLSQRGRNDEAIALARRIYKLWNARKMAYILADLLMQTKPRPDVEIANLLTTVVQPDGGADALAALPLLQSLSPEAIRQSKLRQSLPDMVAALPKVTTMEYLMALDIERVRSPKLKDALVDQAADWNELHPSPEVFRWIIGAGQISKAANTYNSSTHAQKSADFDGVRVALALNKRDYTAARQIIESSKIYDDAQKNVLLAGVAATSGMEDEPQWWEKAFDDAAKDGTGRTAQQIARVAKSVKRDAIRQRALLIAAGTSARDGFSRREALESLNELAKKRDTKTAQLVADAYFLRHPNDPDFANNVLYLSLLLHTDTPDMVEKLEGLRKQYPEQSGLRSTLALAYLRKGRAQDAVNLLSDTALLSDSALAVQAAALNATGHKDQAHSIAQKIDRSNLLTEEEALLKGL
ncbi:MAG: hypothetical protein ABI615_02650 [Chthoniobacterales bacterium]